MIRPSAPPPPALPRLPAGIRAVLDDFRRAQGADVLLWRRDGTGWQSATGAEPERGPGAEAVRVRDAGIEYALEIEGLDAEEARRCARFLAATLDRVLQLDAEGRDLGREIAERYEEITLLYSISEILGAVISLEEATATILQEVVGTLAVRRATLWLFEPEREQLELVAAVGGDGQSGPVAVADPGSVTASVFRTGRSVSLEPREEFPRGEEAPDPAVRGSFLSVPVSYTPPDGVPRTIGVINLIGRESQGAFSAGDQKLISAIASQIGAAVENSRLVAESLRQQRMEREMELAHDLQLKLLPPLDQFDGYADVAARVAPADSVGGDFYHLFRLPGGRLGVVIGDVSGHGFGAALIMALTMSAVAIHASEGDTPAEVLRRAHAGLIDELESTEMYLTLFYAVIDPAAARITYSNAGHSHAFAIPGDGEAVRLPVTNPPFGIVDLDTYTERTHPWTSGEDLLFLFTDGLSDALGDGEVAGSARLVDHVTGRRAAPLPELLDELFRLPAAAVDLPADDRTALLVRF